MNYVISCSSTCDLNNEHLQRRGIVYIPFHYQMDGKPQLDDLGASLSMEDFYAAMDNGADTRTSQINEDEYVISSVEKDEYGREIAHATVTLPDGTYEGELVLETMTPLSFLMN